MKKGIKERFAEAAEFPKDYVLDLARITLLGNKELEVENYKGLLEYTDTLIRLSSNNKQIVIRGMGLTINRLEEDTIFIGGKIFGIEICTSYVNKRND